MSKNLLVVVASLLLPVSSGAQDWPNWRGANYTGTVKAKGLPVSWSRTKNVAWTCPLPGQSAATPIVWNDRVFLTSLDPATKDLLAMCLERASGKVLWRRVVSVGGGVVPSERSRSRENSLAECSPVSDGETVCFQFGTGDLVAFDFDGKELWRRQLEEEMGPFVINWAYASSPLFWKGKVFVEVLHRAKSYVLAIDPKTGKDIWKRERPNKANAESQEAYTTPTPFKNGERDELLILGADCLTSHDPETGAEYWRWCGNNPKERPNYRTVSSPVVCADGVIVVTSPQHNPMHGLKVAGDTVKEIWTYRGATPDSTTPALYEGQLYVVDGRGSRMACLDPQTGEVIFEERLDTDSFIRSSPTAADGKLYVMDAEGTVLVFEAGSFLTELGRFAFESYPSRSSIVIDSNQLLIRTADALYCIGADS